MLRLCPLTAEHQSSDGRARIGAAGEHLGHLRRNRQLDAIASAERERGACRANTLGDHLHVREDIGKRPAACELHADMPVPAEVAGARGDEIAAAAQASQRLTLATRRRRYARYV